ncbi:MAG TPA: hypothetical protein VM533_00925 [Fimbriiglobus sp.]|nr:hypothetical protein [Fimbriiglobus sp.]
MTDRPATPASAGPVPTPGPSWEQPAATPSSDLQPDPPDRVACRGGLTLPDAPTPLPVAATPPRTADRLLAADPDRLPGYAPAPLSVADRPPAEYRALSAAVGCPDLFLADADPGPDQLRFAAELAAEAARAGERVLVVTPTPADADAVFARLTAGPGPLIGRALAGYEHPDRLPAGAAACTARSHRDQLLADARVRAAAGVADAEAKLATLRAAAEAAGPTRAAVARLAELTVGENHPDRDRLQNVTDARAAALARLDSEAQKYSADLEAKRKELAALRDQAANASRRAGGVLGLFKGLFTHKSADDLEPQAKAVEEAVDRLEAEAARVAAERAQVDENYRAARELIGGEDQGRLAELEQAEGDFRRAAAAFVAAGVDEPAPTADAVDRAAAAVTARLATAESDVAAARRSVAELDDRHPTAAMRVLARVRVVIATFDAVGADPLTRPPEGDGPAFDRLVLIAADHLSEQEFDHAARSAVRWVLVGDVVSPRGRHRHGRSSFFRRLWGNLHREVWSHEGGRLVARLADADPDRLACEPLADRPDVELRFTRGRDGESMLADVAFPPTATAAEAKTFLAGEVGEVLLVPCGPVHWHESDERLLACWPAADAPHADWAELAAGVREKVIGTGPDCRTAAVAFECAAGWDRESAERWLADHIGPGPRTAVLPRPTVIASAPARLAAGVSG